MCLLMLIAMRLFRSHSCRVIVEFGGAHALHGRPVLVRHEHTGGTAATDGNQHEEPVDVADAIAGADAVLQRRLEADGRVVTRVIAGTSFRRVLALWHIMSHTLDLPLIAGAPVQRRLFCSIVQRHNGLLLGDAASTEMRITA